MCIRDSLEPLSEGDLQKLRDFTAAEGFAIYLQPKGLDSVHTLDDAPPPKLSFRLAPWDVELLFRPLDFIPVSYTHLDVYKRQAARCNRMTAASSAKTSTPTSTSITARTKAAANSRWMAPWAAKRLSLIHI